MALDVGPVGRRQGEVDGWAAEYFDKVRLGIAADESCATIGGGLEGGLFGRRVRGTGERDGRGADQARVSVKLSFCDNISQLWQEEGEERKGRFVVNFSIERKFWELAELERVRQNG